jgi:hypothetical protein
VAFTSVIIVLVIHTVVVLVDSSDDVGTNEAEGVTVAVTGFVVVVVTSR